MTGTLNNKKILHLFLVLLVFILSAGIRIYYINQKQGLHHDEVMSIMISRYSPQWHQKWNKCTGAELKKKCFWNDGSWQATINDIKKLHTDNRDRPHTNFYYSLLRLWFTGTSSYDLKQTISHGCFLNLLIFSVSFLLFHKLTGVLFRSELIRCLALITAFCNAGTISHTLLLRPYQLQEMWIIAFTYVITLYWNRELTLKCLITLGIVTSFTLLTGYFVAIYVLILFGFFSYKHQEKQNVLKIWYTLAFALFLDQLMYMKFFNGFTCGRAGEGYHSIFSLKIFSNMIDSIKITCSMLYKYLFHAWFMVIPIFTFNTFRTHKKTKINPYIPIIISCLIWSTGNIFLSTLKQLRYITPCFPLLALLLPMIVEHSRYRALIVSSIILINSYNSISVKMPNLHQEAIFLKSFLQTHSSLPARLIITDDCMPFEIIHLCNDQQIYEFCETYTELHEPALVISKTKIDTLSNEYLIPTSLDKVYLYKNP